ncbi:hypothetical protein VP01_1405g4 [Puccinia sorghi]|nr:hypothetical protein VP01_1405g4 [Puccinia sorghi]
MTPDLVLDHLRLHANKQSISGGNLASSSQQVSLFTDYKSTKCKPDAHNTRAPHPQHRCWMLHPHLRPASMMNNTEKNDRAEHSVSSFHSSISHPSMHFVLDSGLSAHMTSNIDLFFAIKLKEEGLVKTSSGAESMKIRGSGSIKLTNEHGNIIFHHVLYVPDCFVNLLSVRCLVLEGYEVLFEINSFLIKQNNLVCFNGNYVNNLPTLQFNNLTHSCMLSSSETLHKALGHVSYRRIRQRLGIPLKDFSACKACAVSKVTKRLFYTRHSKASKPFEEIHLDIVGPISPMSREGHHYFLTVVDSCTRFCSAIPIKSKSDVSTYLTQAIDLEARQIGYYPTVIHSDQGKEFINKYLLDYCNKNLIRTRYSDAYTPQQNGLAERYNQTNIESVRAILKYSGLPLNFWNEIIKTSTLTLNQIPGHKSKRSPFELFKNRSLPLDYFKPIGLCVAFRDLPEGTNSKLAQVGQLGRILGYNDELRSYKVLTDNGKIINSKNLKFLDFNSSISDKNEDLKLEDEMEEENSPSEVIEVEETIPSIDEEEKSENQADQIIKEDVEQLAAEDENSDPEEITASLIPEGRTLRERTIKVKPVKYSYLAGDPLSFQHAMKSKNRVEWSAAAEEDKRKSPFL